MTDGVHPLAFRSTDDSRRSSADQDGVSVPTLLLCNIGHLKCRLLYCPWIFRLTEGVNIVIFPWQWLICWCETISNGGYILELVIYTLEYIKANDSQPPITKMSFRNMVIAGLFRTETSRRDV